jgi:type III pantothenate kinase
MIACIDIGNTTAKLGYFEKGQTKPISIHQFSNVQDVVAHIADTSNVEGIIVSDVSGEGMALKAALADSNAKVMWLDMHTELPIINAYSSPESLGADRLALACGAYKLYGDKDNLVIALGTCITYNLMFANRYFRGGVISPGMQMRLDAMHQMTGQLPQVAANGFMPVIGHDTETSIRLGAVRGAVLEIEGTIALYKAQYPDINVVLTGGDESLLGSMIKSEKFVQPNLVLVGLMAIYEFNDK